MRAITLMRIVVHVELRRGAGKGGETMTGVEAGYVGNLLFAVTARASLVDVMKGGNERRENLLDIAQQKLNSPVYSHTRFASFRASSSLVM